MSEPARRDPVPAALPDLSVQSFAACEVAEDVRLVGAPVDADTVYLVLAGKLHLSVATGEVTAGAGSLVLVPAGLQPGIAASAAPRREHVATRERLAQRGGLLVFDAARGKAGALRVMVGRVRGPLVAALSHAEPRAPVVADLKNAPLARAIYATLRDELDRPTAGLPTLAATLMKACVLLFVRTVQQGEPAVPQSGAGNRVAAVAATIRAKPSEAYSIAALADLAGMSRATFTRRFQRHIGTTPMDFVLRVRLRDAAGLLRTTTLSVKQVAADVGFRSRSHFSRAFQAHFGIDPSRFRMHATDDRSVENVLNLPILSGTGA